MIKLVHKNTPWGIADSAEDVAEGITFYSTPSHGGYLISASRRKQMPKKLRDLKTLVGGNWYEEDCDAAIVAAAFPEVFGEEVAKRAMETVLYWNPELAA